MAIYKNREVSIVGPNPQLNNPDSITVAYADGTHENVKLSEVKFTADEKKLLVKSYPSRYDNVDTVSDEDLKAIRIGIAPPSDPAVIEQARIEALRQKQVEEGQKQQEAAIKDAKKDQK